MQTLNIAPPQVTVKARFVEVTQNDTKALGFDWITWEILMLSKGIGLQGGTAPSYNDGRGGTFPGSAGVDASGTAFNTLQAACRIGRYLLTSGLRNSMGTVNVPALGTLSGILTDPQFRVVLHAIEQRDGADLLTEGQVTTLSGRQAQIQVIDLKYIVTTQNTGVGGGGGTAMSAGGKR